MCYKQRMNDCIFCKIISHQAPGYIISETDDVIVLVSKHNDPLVIPKKHVQDIYALDEKTGNAVMKSLVDTAQAVKKGLACDGVYITQANEPAAGQDVFHLHFHVYPRWEDHRKNQAGKASDEERKAICEKVKRFTGN